MEKIKIEKIELASFGTYLVKNFNPKLTLIFDVQIGVEYSNDALLVGNKYVSYHTRLEVDANELLFNCDGVYDKFAPNFIKLSKVTEFLIDEVSKIAEECNVQELELPHICFDKKLADYKLGKLD